MPSATRRRLLPSVEPWRERRRAERAARQLRDADEETEAPAEPEPGAPEAMAVRQPPLEDESPVESVVDDSAVQPCIRSADGLP